MLILPDTHFSDIKYFEKYETGDTSSIPIY